jgi:ABC-type bacteriocin/lantibiotic exporter with double-glycine peptidase domain
MKLHDLIHSEGQKSKRERMIGWKTMKITKLLITFNQLGQLGQQNRTKKELIIMNQNNAIIEIENITKVYQMGEMEVKALRGVSLTIHSGEYVAIMGSSGSGKSTLMNTIGLLDRPTTGSYKIRGFEASDLPKNRLADLRNHEIGFIFQQFNLLAPSALAGRWNCRSSMPACPAAKPVRWLNIR